MAQSSKQPVVSLPEIASATEVSLTLPENLSFDDWSDIGAQLSRARTRLFWLIGDWWCYGELRYGERKAIVVAEDWDGPAFQTCMNCAAVARAFETSRRREVLTFTHHAEVASLPRKEADRLLDWCLDGENNRGCRSTRELRLRVREVHAEREQAVIARMAAATKTPQPVTSIQIKRLPPETTGAPLRLVLANTSPEPAPERDRVAIARAAVAALSPEERLDFVSDLAAELSPDEWASLVNARAQRG